MTGSLFRQFGWTASAAVLFSLLVARLLTPMMAAYLLKPRPRQHVDGLLMTRYLRAVRRSEEHTSELQSLMRISYAVFCLKKKKKRQTQRITNKHAAKYKISKETKRETTNKRDNR